MAETTDQIYHCQDGTEIPISWRTSTRNRNIRLTVASSGVRVSSPPRTKWSLVEKFLKSQETWLKTHLERQVPEAPNTLLYQGAIYQVQVSPNQNLKRVHLREDTCFVSPISLTAESAYQTLERWLRSEAAEKLTPIFLECRQLMDTQAGQLRWRDTRSRWGSCSADGQIMLSWRLIHAPEEVARYVIIHELAHRTHHNHSSHFWKLVAQYDPAYKLHRGWLKRHGHECQTPDFSHLMRQ